MDSKILPDKSVLYPNLTQQQKKLLDISKVLSEMRQAIRIKHYSYRTERSYISYIY